jgi:hypothetical protein
VKHAIRPLVGDRLAAFERALEQPGFYRRLDSFARSHAKRFQALPHSDAGYAAQVVRDVVGKTFEGLLTWDPRVSLFTHLAHAICLQMRHDRDHASRFRRDFVDDDPLTLDAEAISEGDAQRRRLTAGLVAMRQLAAGDEHLLRLLDALEQGATSRSSVIEDSGLSLAEYEAAHERLVRLR